MTLFNDSNLTPPPTFDRRAFLGRYAGAVGSLALGELLGRAGLSNHALFADEPGTAASTAPQSPPKAKSVICLFQHGGPSQVDLFDPKPELSKRHGEPYPGQLEAHFVKQMGNLLGSPFKFQKHGQAGIELSELLPHTGRVVDHLTLVRSMTTESVDHEASLRLIHTGKLQAGRPTIGAWTVYALGSQSDNLPAYVVLTDPGGLPIDGVRNWSSGWLPAIYQGTPFRSGPSPVLYLDNPSGTTVASRRTQLEWIEQLNRAHLARHAKNTELEARLRDFEMAARMQMAVPEVLDLSRESAETRELYGINDKETQEYGTRCLLARRLVEQGVRYVQIFLNGQPWDTHSKNADSLRGLCRRADRPSAALVEDLSRRGMLDSTIVLWTGEFGRLPISQGNDGRDHNRHAFSLWVAGGGFKQGYAHGATDEFGYKSVDKIVTIHDLHATILKSLGLDHQKLTYPYDGREDSLTDEVVTHARVADELLA